MTTILILLVKTKFPFLVHWAWQGWEFRYGMEDSVNRVKQGFI